MESNVPKDREPDTQVRLTDDSVLTRTEPGSTFSYFSGEDTELGDMEEILSSAGGGASSTMSRSLASAPHWAGEGAHIE